MMPLADPWASRPTRILRRRDETADTFTLELDAPAGAFEPGQFNMLWSFGVGEVPISISGDPDAGGNVVHTIRAVGTVTHAIAKLGPGGAIGVRGPYGSHWPVTGAEGGDLVILAGGLGLAPLRPVIYRALRRRERFRRLTLMVGAREPEGIVFRDELDRWAEEGRIDVRVTVDHASQAWRGQVGVVTALLDRIDLDAPRTTAFVCGPEVMMRFATRSLEARGIPRERCWVSMERSMKCGVGFCGHCQVRELLLCKDGPVLPFSRAAALLGRREL
jgi:NAD(P)H-flavin reductase